MDEEVVEAVVVAGEVVAVVEEEEVATLGTVLKS